MSNDFSKSYRKNYQNYGARYADVDWSGKSDLYAAHVGNYKSSDAYNATMCELHLSYCNEYLYLDSNDQWDWGENKDLRLQYDDMRNKSEQLERTEKPKPSHCNELISSLPSRTAGATLPAHCA